MIKFERLSDQFETFFKLNGI